MIEDVEEEPPDATRRCPRSDLELALEEAVEELAEHGSGAQGEADRDESEQGESAKDRRLKLRGEALKAVACGRSQSHRENASVGLIGAEQGTVSKQDPAVNGNGEGA